ncbi:type I-E CRISPR-associated protein Cse1/CasA [Vibrio vulnificus]|uniref:type I-E CRISPR-associated protein Cse1/CasA n=1 Tax=Vibrio vulnificus TaxID=672 RepID=UPI00102BE949|nr:type I-E CRISPR-associated protein Cse1/CasA [Vibrio vulnificus]MCU8269052.1 type I-E CRISPR-associated protein Cse1/CasA [Vibrio vulnificus]RZR41758.1 type I-E CRISPR-associated protein Cse1/CasA [Vibrio vulnificus]
MENRFNLIDEPWIPITDIGLVSLKQLFSEKNYRSLGGTPLEKIAVTKFLLAITQSACTPEDDAAWNQLGVEGLASACLTYLEKWHDRFYLYGEKPFLQMPAVEKAEVKSFGAVMPDVATGNTTCLTQYHAEKPLGDSQKALLLLTQMSLAFGGKKTDNKVVLTPGYAGKANDKGKPATGRSGPAVGFMGLLHSFAIGPTLHISLWLNLLTHHDIREIGLFSQGLGQAPWENMPDGEDCETAKVLKNSVMGRLVPLCRFCLFSNDGLHYTEGLQHLGHKEGLFDLSITTKQVGKELKVEWCNPERRPWRQLPALLAFISQTSGRGGCLQLKYALTKANLKEGEFGVWSGGIKVNSNAGEQYLSGKDDVLESTLLLPSGITGQIWFEKYVVQMDVLDTLAKRLFGCVSHYFKALNKDGKEQASNATLAFWQLCERDAQQLLYDCDNPEAMGRLRRRFATYIQNTFDSLCPNQTARQLDAWAKHRPNISDYLKQETL